MKFLEIIASAIGRVWSFATTIILISFISAIVFFGFTVFMPEQIINAVNIFKNLLKIA